MFVFYQKGARKGLDLKNNTTATSIKGVRINQGGKCPPAPLNEMIAYANCIPVASNFYTLSMVQNLTKHYASGRNATDKTRVLLKLVYHLVIALHR